MYNNNMKFEWDPQKNRTNRLKHKIDFESAKRRWEDPDRIEIRAPHPIENHYILIGKMGECLWSAVYDTQGRSCSNYFSQRRSKKQEIKLYEQEKTREEQ